MSMFKNLFGDQPEQHEKVDLSKRYNLIARVGQGSMSRVWRADDAINARFVAIKILDKEKTERYESRFPGLNKPTEADIALSLRHPNVVRTLECGWTLEDEMFLVMEYVEGSGLGLLVDLQSDQMRQYRLRYMIQIGESLSYFHEHNWIHRDVCPRNIMITEDNHVKLIDFGLTVPDTPDFRKPGNRTGTANYMAPELIKRQPTDQRVDVFSYAVTCFEMYTKRHPWEAAMTLDAVLQHINLPPVQIIDLVPKIDPKIADIIMKGLEANPANRWQTVAEMVTALRNEEGRLVRETRELLIKQKQAAAHKKSNGKTAQKKSGTNSDTASLKRKSRPSKDNKSKGKEAKLTKKNSQSDSKAKEVDESTVATTDAKPPETASPEPKKNKPARDKSADESSPNAENAAADVTDKNTDLDDGDRAAPEDAKNTDADQITPKTKSTEAVDNEEIDSDEET
jgi:eukaryotic-like serine/threonine-protein kinase